MPTDDNESSMSLSIADLGIIIDTLYGTLSIADRRDLPIFSYTKEARESLAKRLLAQMDAMQIEIRLTEAQGG